MSNNAAALETVIAEDVETEEIELSLDGTISELVDASFEGNETVTAYRIATIINGVFEVHGLEKRIPTQMMYNYDRNGLIVKGKKGVKAYNKDEVTAYVTKYASKFVK